MAYYYDQQNGNGSALVPSQNSDYHPLVDHNGRQILPDKKVWGDFAIPPALTYSGIMQSGWNTYLHDRWDEAMRFSRDYARTFLRDDFTMSLFQERRDGTASQKWHIEVDDEHDPQQAYVKELVTTSIKRIKHFRQFLDCLLWEIWYGRMGVEILPKWITIKGERVLTVDKFTPINGDKIGHRFDGTPYVLIYPGFADAEFPGSETIYSTLGPALLLKGGWRERVVLARHQLIDQDFYEAEKAEAVNGVGVRDVIAYGHWLRNEYMAQISDFMERVGLGLMVYFFEKGNQKSEQEAEQAALKQNRRGFILWPISPEMRGLGDPVRRYDTPVMGVEALRIMVKHMEENEERFIVGQSMSSGRDNKDGLGGTGRAKFAENTKRQRIEYDCLNIADTLTTDLVELICRWLPPRIYNGEFGVRFVFDIDEPDPREFMESAKIFAGMGGKLKEDQVRSVMGFDAPAPTDNVIGGQQTLGMGSKEPGAPVQEGLNPGAPPPANGQGEDIGRGVEHYGLFDGQKSSSQGGLFPTVEGKQGDKGHYVTINGNAVFIVGGSVQQGHSKVKEVPFKAHPEGQHFADEAGKLGIDPKHVHQLANEFLAHDQEFIKERTRMLHAARILSKHYGQDLQSLVMRHGKGNIDPASLKRFDEVATSMASTYPDQFRGHEESSSQRLFDLLIQGNPKLDKSTAYRQAFDYLYERHQEEHPDTTHLEPAPFQRTETPEQYARNMIQIPDHAQQTSHTCQAAAHSALCEKFGVQPDTEEKAVKALGISAHRAIQPLASVEEFMKSGLTVQASENMTLSDLRRLWEDGKPVMVFIQDYGNTKQKHAKWTGHCVTVVGLWSGQVLIADPSQDNVPHDSDAAPGIGMISEKDFLENWHVEDADGRKWNRFGIALSKKPVHYIKDASGHEHAPAGSREGGQFISTGGPHPLEGMTREQAVGKMTSMHNMALGKDMGQNPFHYEPDKISDEQASQVLEAVQASKPKNAFQRATIKDAFAKLKGKMSLFEFQTALAKLEQQGKLTLGPYTQALSTHDSPEHVMPWRREWQNYIG